MKKIILLFSAVLSITLFSCNSDDTFDTEFELKNKVIVMNQGNYTEQNASIYIYDEDTKVMTPNAYSTANNGTKLGATLMSATFSTTGVGYLLCSNPDKIEIVDILSMKTITTPVTTELSNTREIAGGGGYLFVSNAGKEYNVLPDGSYEYTNSYISVYSATSLAYIAKVEVGSDAQGMVFHEGRLYVGTKDGIAILIKEGGNSFELLEVYKDEEFPGAVKYLTVMNNRIYASVPGYGVLEFDPYDGRVRKRFEMPLDSNGYITQGPDNMIYTCATIYNTTDWSVESSNVYQLDPSSGNVKTVASGQYLYSVGVSHYSKNIYTSEANGFQTNSTINIIDPQNGFVGSTTGGVGTFRYLFVSYAAPKEQ